jgi:hypothetical protein
MVAIGFPLAFNVISTSWLDLSASFPMRRRNSERCRRIVTLRKATRYFDFAL